VADAIVARLREDGGRDDDGLLFATKNHAPLIPHNVHRSIRAILALVAAEAGPGERLTKRPPKTLAL
jgi:hypothetical protein